MKLHSARLVAQLSRNSAKVASPFIWATVIIRSEEDIKHLRAGFGDDRPNATVSSVSRKSHLVQNLSIMIRVAIGTHTLSKSLVAATIDLLLEMSNLRNVYCTRSAIGSLPGTPTGSLDVPC